MVMWHIASTSRLAPTASISERFGGQKKRSTTATICPPRRKPHKPTTSAASCRPSPHPPPLRMGRIGLRPLHIWKCATARKRAKQYRTMRRKRRALRTYLPFSIRWVRPMSDLVAKAITEVFGERCPDFEPECHCCKAWAEFDRITTLEAELE